MKNFLKVLKYVLHGAKNVILNLNIGALTISLLVATTAPNFKEALGRVATVILFMNLIIAFATTWVTATLYVSAKEIAEDRNLPVEDILEEICV